MGPLKDAYQPLLPTSKNLPLNAYLEHGVDGPGESKAFSLLDCDLKSGVDASEVSLQRLMKK